MAFLLYKVRSYTVCRSLNRAGPSRHARSTYLSKGPTRARGSKDPIPEYRRERSECRVLLTAGRLLPRGLFLDKTLTVLYPARSTLSRADGADGETGHEGRITGRVRLYPRGGMYAVI